MTLPRLAAHTSVALLVVLAAGVASAQSLGTHRWQLEPFCNVVTVNVVQTGGVLTLDGWDDQCGGTAPRAPVTGAASLNPDGTIGLGLNVVTAPAGASVHIGAAITLNTGSGSWRDSSGNTGQFSYNPPATVGGRARPDAHAHSGPGTSNTRFGQLALRRSTGSRNVAIGDGAMNHDDIPGILSPLAGSNNTAIGVDARARTDGDNNVAIGAGAGYCRPFPSLRPYATSNDIYIGANVGCTGGGNFLPTSGSIYIGSSQSTRAFLQGVWGTTVGTFGNAVPVVIDGSGQMGTVSSSRRVKDNIEDLGPVSRAIFDLRPVSFTYKQSSTSGTASVQYGLIAEEVAEVLPELVARGRDGQIETVKYHVLPTLLVAEVQRLERERAAQAEEIAALREAVQTLQRQLATSPRQ